MGPYLSCTCEVCSASCTPFPRFLCFPLQNAHAEYQHGVWKCSVCECTDFCSSFTVCHDLSGTASSPPETAPNAEAKCAQQAVRLLSEYLSSCHRQSSANKSTSASMDVVSSAGGSEDTRRSSERPTPKQKQVSSQAEPGLSSQSVLSASGAAESRVDEQQCTVMWAEACDEHFPQVRLVPPNKGPLNAV